MSEKSCNFAPRSPFAGLMRNLTWATRWPQLFKGAHRKPTPGGSADVTTNSSRGQSSIESDADNEPDAPLVQTLTRRSTLKLASVPVVTGLIGIQRATRIDVTSATQAGANVVGRSNGAVDLRTKLNNLIDALGPEGGVLYFPPSGKNPETDFYALTSGPIYLKNNVSLEGLSGYENETVLRNVAPAATGFYVTSTVRFGGTQYYTYLDPPSSPHVFRTIQDTIANQDYIVCDTQSDANACRVGDQIFLASPQFYMDPSGSLIEEKCLWMMHNYITSKSGKQLKLLWPIPFALQSKQQGFPSYSPTGAPIFFRTSEVLGPPPYNKPGQMIVSRNIAIRNMTLACNTGNVMQTQLPIASELENLIIYAPVKKGIYGNAAQMTLFRNIVCRCGQGAAEIAMSSFANRCENISLQLTRDCVENGGMPAVLWAWQEGSWGNTLDGLSVPKQKYKWAPQSNANVFRDTGYNNTMMNMNVVLQADGGILFYNCPQNNTAFSDGWRLKGRVIHGAKVTYESGKGPGTIINAVNITQHTYEGIRIINPARTPGITLSAASHHNVFRDWDITNANIVINAGATANEFTRVYQRSGTFVDNGTGTIKAQRTAAPQLGKYGV